MVPSALVALDALPLTANGKVDRKALPAPEAPSRVAAPTSRPRTPTEEQLAALWAERARRARRSAPTTTSSSWAATRCWPPRLVSRVRAAFGVELPLRALFEAPTVAALAAAHRLPLGWPARRVSPAAARPCAADGRAAAVLRPAAPLVPRPARARQRRLQHARRRCGSTGALDVAALQRALSTSSSRRHESLRTTFAAHGRPARPGHPPPRGAARCRWWTCSACPRPRARPRPGVWPREEARAALRPGARARCCAPRCCAWASDEHVLLLTMHHIVSDGWSMGVLVRELAALYDAFAAGQALAAAARCPSSTPTTPSGSASGCRARCWTRSSATGSEQLAGAPPRWSCPPTGRVRPCSRYRGATLPVRAARASCPRRSRRSCQQRGRHALHGAAGRLPGAAVALLRPGRHRGRHAHRRPHARRARGPHRLLRQHAGAAHAPGRRRRPSASCWRRCSETHARRLRAPGRALREAGGGAAARARPEPHAALPGDVRPAERARPRRCAAGPHAAAAGAGRGTTSKFDLRSSLGETPEGFARRARVQHRPLRRRPPSARMLAHLQRAAGGHRRAARRARCRELPLLTRRGAAAGCSSSGTTPRVGLPARRLRPRRSFEAQARAHARRRRRGVRGRARSPTRELDARANQLAAPPARAGRAARTSASALCVERSLELVVGAARHPQGGRRLRAARPGLPRASAWRFMLEDAGAPRAAHPAAPARRAARARGAASLCLDADARRRRRASPTPLRRVPRRPRAPGLRHLHLGLAPAGPRASRVPHRARRATSCAGTSGATPLRPERRVAAARRRSRFDASVWELFGAAAARRHGSSCSRRRARRTLRARCVRWLGATRITTLLRAHAPAAARCRRRGAAERPAPRAASCCGGEALPARAARGSCAGCPARALVNPTAPPRAPSYCHLHAACPRDAGGARRPIGRPIANTQRLRPRRARCGRCPSGVPGELLHRRRRRGARLPRPARSSPPSASSPIPFSATPGARLYRTGDLVRWLRRRHARVPRPPRPPGEGPRLPHRAGRDRGRARAQHPACARPWSLAREDVAGRQAAGRLRRAPSRRDAGTPSAARASSRSGCPSTWCPRPSCVLDALPLTPNGKVDRKALPAPEARRARARRLRRAARRRPRRRSPRIWAEVLRRGARRRRTTTSSTSAATRCWPPSSSPASARRFGVELPLRALFEAPTVAGARRARRRPRARPRRRLPPLAPRAARRRRCRCPSPSSGSGSSISSSPASAVVQHAPRRCG